MADTATETERVSRSQMYKHEDAFNWLVSNGYITDQSSGPEVIAAFAANRNAYRKSDQYHNLVSGRAGVVEAERAERAKAREEAKAAKAQERAAAKAAKAEAAAAAKAEKAASEGTEAAPAKATRKRSKADTAETTTTEEDPFA